MDFKSPQGWNAPIGPWSVLDDHSRYLLALQAVGRARAELGREPLEVAFVACGVPEARLMDQGQPWWSATGPTGATQLTVGRMKHGIRLHWSGYRHPPTPGKVERFQGALERALRARGGPGEEPPAWLDAYRWAHNQVRPHEALGVRTPASGWRKSARKFDPRPPRWEYAAGAKGLKVDSPGKLDAYGGRWRISKVLRGEWVQLERIEQRVLMYYCRTLIRELDLGNQRSTAVERWFPSSDS